MKDVFPEHLTGPEAQVYVLRVWRPGADAGWRVTLRDARSGGVVGFTDLDELMLFLLRVTQPGGTQPRSDETL